jgi:archaeal flagellar protein FlaH
MIASTSSIKEENVMLGVTVTKNTASTGQKDIADALGGSINENSLVLIEGESNAGKSVICQYLAYHAIETKGKSVAYFTTEHLTDSLVTQMKSINMDVSTSIKGRRFLTYEIEPAMDLNSSVHGLCSILKRIVRLPMWYKYVILDTPSRYLLRLSTATQIEFLLRLKSLCADTRSVIVVLNTEVMGSSSLSRAHEMCDYYLKLTSENRVLQTGQINYHNAKLMHVTKLNGVEQPQGKVIRFDVVPDYGIQILPFYHVKV